MTEEERRPRRHTQQPAAAPLPPSPLRRPPPPHGGVRQNPLLRRLSSRPRTHALSPARSILRCRAATTVSQHTAAKVQTITTASRWAASGAARRAAAEWAGAVASTARRYASAETTPAAQTRAASLRIHLRRQRGAAWLGRLLICGRLGALAGAREGGDQCRMGGLVRTRRSGRHPGL